MGIRTLREPVEPEFCSCRAGILRLTAQIVRLRYDGI